MLDDRKKQIQIWIMDTIDRKKLWRCNDSWKKKLIEELDNDIIRNYEHIHSAWLLSKKITV